MNAGWRRQCSVRQGTDRALLAMYVRASTVTACLMEVGSRHTVPNTSEKHFMDAQASRKLIIAGVMAVVVGVGVTTFALRAHTVAQKPQAITAPVQPGSGM